MISLTCTDHSHLKINVRGGEGICHKMMFLSEVKVGGGVVVSLIK